MSISKWIELLKCEFGYHGELKKVTMSTLEYDQCTHCGRQLNMRFLKLKKSVIAEVDSEGEVTFKMPEMNENAK